MGQMPSGAPVQPTIKPLKMHVGKTSQGFTSKKLITKQI